MCSGRSTLSLLKHSPTHGGQNVHLELRKVEVIFLPPSKTSQIQLMYAEIFAAEKAKIRCRLFFWTLHNTDIAP